MNNFSFYSPTFFEFGQGAEAKTGELIRQFGGTKVLLHYGGGSIRKNGVYGKVIAALTTADIPFTELGGVVPNPRSGLVYEGIELAKKEAKNGELPPYEGSAPDLSQYDTVFIGGPVWWGTYPQVMFTLFKDINLDGKTVIPFTTHEGSGLASCESDVRKAFPKANVQKGWSIYGHEVRTNRAKVEKWLQGLGY